ncbi:hypothetical protein Tco_1380122 [Tanacetum coccineum]
MQLNELMDLCAKLFDRVLALENTNTFQAAEIATLKERVKKLEKKRRSRTYKPKRLYKVGLSRRIESSDEASLGAQEDASKQGWKIDVIDVDAEVTLMDETQGMNDDNLMFDTCVLDEHEVEVEKRSKVENQRLLQQVEVEKVVSADEVVTTASVEIPDELTLAQTLMEIKSAKPKVVTTAATTVTPVSTRPKAKGVVIRTFEDEEERLDYAVRQEQKEALKEQGDELESDNSKKQKLDEHVDAEIDDDQEEAEIKKHMEIVQDDEVAVDAIPLATKPPVIVEYKIVKEGRIGYFQLIRADGSSRRYSSMIQILLNINKEDLETLWKLVKAKHRNTRPEEGYERVLRGDLKVMFEPDVESEVWRNLQGYKVTVWKLFSSCGLHFVRFQNMHIFMLVEKKYPLTPATITEILNKKLQTDYWNEMFYQLLKLMTKQVNKK